MNILFRLYDFKEEPDAPFRLVDPRLQQACGSDIVSLHRTNVSFMRAISGCLLAIRQACRGDRHTLRRCPSGVAGGNVPDGHRAEMVVPKVRSAHVPMKVLGLHIERKNIAQQCSGSAADVLDGSGGEVAARRSSGLAARRKFVFSREPHCNKVSPGWSYFTFSAANRRPRAVASDNRPISPISGIALPVVGNVAGSCP